MKDQKVKEQFIELRAQGWSFVRIAKKLKVSKQTLINWSKELKLQISNMKAIELEALQEQYYLDRKARIEILGGRLQKFKEEIEKRDLKDIPTAKLYELFLKYHDFLKTEATPVTFHEAESFNASLDDLSFNAVIKEWQA